MRGGVRRSVWLRGLGIVLGVGVLLVVWREYAMRKLPFDDVQLSPFSQEQNLEIPPRPGVRGIVITGPTIEPLLFTIDLAKAGIRSLDWRQLRAIDPHTDVKLRCRINDQGWLVFSPKDVLMEGHTEAGVMIQQALKTWCYTPYKSGEIRFWFNLPSKGGKLIIDTKDLQRKGDIPDYIPIYDGQLHLIEGIPFNEIRVGRDF